MANSTFSELAGPGPVHLQSMEHYQHLMSQVRANLETEIGRALQQAGDFAPGAVKEQAKHEMLEQYWDGLLEIIHANIKINGEDVETTMQLQNGEVEPYDEKLNKDVMAFQEEVASAVVRNTSERKAVGNRRLHELRVGLEAARPADAEPPKLQPPIALGGLPDHKATVHDFHEALTAAKRVQQTSGSARFDEVLALESALATVQGGL